MSEWRITILGRPVSKKNGKQIGRRMGRMGLRHFVRSSDNYLAWASTAKMQVAAQWRGQAPIESKVRLEAEFTVYLGKGQLGDFDNAVSGPADVLQQARVIENDAQIKRAIVEVRRDWARPRVEVVLRHLLDRGA